MDNQEIELQLDDDNLEMELQADNAIILREENVIESISVNGIEQPVDENKNVDITVPIKISDLTNDNNTVQDANYVHTDNNFTTTEKNKLANLENYDDTEIKADIQELETNKANKSETYTKTETDALLQDKADTEDIPDVSDFITKDVNNLTNYTLKTNTGSLIDLEINSTTYVVTLRLKDIDGNVISTDTIDLPLESVVVSGRYDNTTKKVILTLENGSEVDFSVADLVAGLQTEITSTNKLASDLVDDTNSGNKFVTTSEKQTWNNKLDEEDLTDYVKNTDYATSDKAGVIKANTNGFLISGVGSPFVKTYNYNEYQSMADYNFIGKRTLENVIVGKNLETADNKVTEINETNTDTQYPSAKAVNNKMANLGTTKTASGTSIDITDSAEGNMPLGIKANTSQQTYTGINILDPNKFTTNAIAENIDNTTNVITLKQNNTENFCRIFNDLGLPAGNYTIWCEIISGTYNGGNLCFYDLNNTQYATEFSFKNSSRHYINLNLSAGLNRLQIWDTRCSTEVKIKIWILSGTYTTETMPDYEPYVGGKASPNPEYPQEVKTVTGEVNVRVQNKNSLSTEFEQGFYNVSDGITKVASDNYVRTINKVSVIPNTQYIFSENGVVRYGNILSYASDGTYLGSSPLNESFTSASNCTQIHIMIYRNGGITPSDLVKPQLEKGSTATEYIEHQEQNYPLNLGDIELCKIGDYQDYIHKDNGKWYKHKEIGKLQISENVFNSYSEAANTDYIYCYSATYDNLIADSFAGLSSHFINYGRGMQRFTDEGYSLYSFGGSQWAKLRFMINKNLLEDTSSTSAIGQSLNKLFSEKQPVFYYPLATPIEEEITEPTLIAQLEAIYNNAKSYEGETHIFTITENESPYIEAEYSIDNVENTANKVTNIDENSTNKQYPSAKAVYDYGQSIADKGEVYSTEEQVIGTWIDGKPLYRKVVEFNSGSVGSHTIGTLSADVSSNIDKVVSYDGNYYVSGGYSTVKINLFFNEGENNNIYIASTGEIREFHSLDSYNNKTIIITFLYTKTTD